MSGCCIKGKMKIQLKQNKSLDRLVRVLISPIRRSHGVFNESFLKQRLPLPLFVIGHLH